MTAASAAETSAKVAEDAALLIATDLAMPATLAFAAEAFL